MKITNKKKKMRFLKFSENMKIIRSQSAGVKYQPTAPQRLHTEKLIYAYLVGLTEADGWFCYFKNGVYITFEMAIEFKR